ncbi:helix-turn-helix domain-containing protein (plasmid) [Rhizobium sp. CB3171]|uniref:winged helix-turn-helix transcriptional regulator n=1 Tax=Rhizobium sp. CB3171 TaxID=3039157 RepID=UPI0024B17D66|nr:helix-turn-helix domain-containing protein [Rhizobium sp. CB3171]WFU06623.1 helix-turn-helix domain-containing protein [Rhizobium sp. CB3171]
MRKQRHQVYANCPVEAALDIVGGKWKAILIFHVLDGPKRFGELGRLLPGLTQRMLTTQLRELEADHIITRTIYPQVPPKVEYSITPFGQTLVPVLRELALWAEDHVKPLIEQARHADAEARTINR